MRVRLHLAWLLVAVGIALGGAHGAAAQSDTVEKVAVVYSCETVDCSDADGVKDPMAGATVTSYDASGGEVDSCTTEANGQCLLLIPAAEDGSYEVIAGPGFEGYTLVSSTPDVTGEAGDGREWTFVPTDVEPVNDIAVNVVACDVADCTNPSTMDGAVVEAYQGGELVDSCTVSSEPADFDGCWLATGGATDPGFEIYPASGFEDYVLASDEPEVFDIDREGANYQVLVWTFVPVDDDGEVTPEPTVSATVTPTQAPGQVAELPSTGSGSTAADLPGLAVAFAAVGLMMTSIAAAMSIRRR